MQTNSRSNPNIKPVFRLKQFLNTIVTPEFGKDNTNRIKNSIESSRFASYHNISNSVRKNIIINQQYVLPSITNRKSLIIEPTQTPTVLIDHLHLEQNMKNNTKQIKKHFRQLKNLSIAQNSNDNLNSTNEELLFLQSNKNSPKKYKTSNKQDQQKSRKQKLIDFLKGENQGLQFTQLLQKKQSKQQTLFPSFTIKKYQELQF
ncbi:unnamed protein product (macronuclear) [Paramecium tetraurelia]|uniref:Uncharacterized protein n=1 Tax=Paramecium tetraurelia TaxID=5888 RepID=A0D3E9_PARTE|nr:uncharacterized protein GSPATT00013052001 [Paramecium tetraurelia]CAK77566.1 unnamed protein product [Paramecium tetraurelia]|eukprot:XP_001444963.1 hypothetical protein (macronuclear) [Paramecium tetraurelia strain d4-2]